MNNEDKKYLRAIERMRPNLRAFKKMVEILKDEQEEINKLFLRINSSLLETYDTIR